MARDFARAFYHSRAWKETRDAYMRSVHGLCERCLAHGRVVPAEIVHHKVHLSPDNIDDPDVSLSFDNLEAVCRQCHADLHPEIYGFPSQPRVRFDAQGNIIRPEED